MISFYVESNKQNKLKNVETDNQDGGIGRHAAPPRTTRTDRKLNRKEVRHQVDEKETFIQTSRRGGDGNGVERTCVAVAGWRLV